MSSAFAAPPKDATLAPATTDVTGAWSNYQRLVYGSRKAPAFTMSTHDLENLARQKLPHDNFTYAAGSAGTGETCRSNVDAFKSWKIVPRMLRDANKRDLRIKLFGTEYSSPILIAPIGVQSLFHQDAEEATARAAHKLGVPMIMSTAACRTIEQVATANGDGQRWYQLYWPVTKEVTISLLNRAKAAGFTTLVVTLDTTLLGFRPNDLDTSHLPFLDGKGCAVGFSDPVFCAREGLSHQLGSRVLEKGSPMEIGQASYKWLGEVNSGYFHSWKDLKHLRDNWEGPIVLKGVQTVEDALEARKMGVEGIIVSNHGGRQIDGAISSLSALEIIGADDKVKESGLTILFDSGIRTGRDVITALALGADAVLVGRPYIYGLALEGQGGVEHVLRTVLAETEVTMGLMGVNTVADLDRSCIRKV